MVCKYLGRKRTQNYHQIFLLNKPSENLFRFYNTVSQRYMMRNARKGPLCNLWTMKALISLHIHAGLSGPLLSAAEPMDTVVCVDE